MARKRGTDPAKNERPGLSPFSRIALCLLSRIHKAGTVRALVPRLVQSPFCSGPIVEWLDNQREKLLKSMQDIRDCDNAQARLADLEHRKADTRAILGEFGIDPDTEPEFRGYPA